MRRFTVSVAIVLFLLALVARPSSERATAQKPSNDRSPEAEGRGVLTGPDLQETRALLMIVGDPLRPGDRLSINDGRARQVADDAIRWLIASWSLQGADPEEFREYVVDFTHLPASPEEHTLGLLTVRGRGDVAKILALAQKHLQEALLEIHRRSLDPLKHKMALADNRRARAEQMTQRVTNELQALRQQALQSGQALQPQDTQLFASVKRDNLAMRAEIAGLQAQREAIVEQIAKAKARLDAAQTPRQSVLDELAMVVKLREQEFARMQTLFKKGYVTQAELAKGEVALAQAKADLVDRRRTLVQEAGGGQLGRLNEQLVDTQIAITTTEARLEETDRALVELEHSAYSPVNSLVIKYQRTRRALDSAWAEEEAAAAEQARLEMARDAISAPKVIAIGGAGKPK